MQKETYKVKVYCRNCEWKGEQGIEKGCSVKVLSLRECPVCGCEELKSLGISLSDNQWAINI